MQKTDLPLHEILALDRVQKRLPLPDAMINRLRRHGLIEGRKPNLHVSASVAKVTAGKASREEIDKLLLDKWSDALAADQKFNKIENLLTKLRRRGSIVNKGSNKRPSWEIAERIAE